MSDTVKHVDGQQVCMKRLNGTVRHSIYGACVKYVYAANMQTSISLGQDVEPAQIPAAEQCSRVGSPVLPHEGTSPSLSARIGDAQGQDADTSLNLPSPKHSTTSNACCISALNRT